MIPDSKKPAIHQLASCIAYPDAVSNYVLTLDQVFQNQGHKTKIFATYRHPNKPINNLFSTEEFLHFINNPNSIYIAHYSIADQTAELFLRSKGKKVLVYHNITPEHFFSGYNDQLAKLCANGRKFLKNFKSVDLVIALSEFSKNELIDHGIPPHKIQVIPFISDLTPPSPRIHRSLPHSELQLSTQNLLFVGKVAPHKKVEDLIKSFYLYQKYFHPNTHLHIAGILGNDLYENELRTLTNRLEIKNKVIFHGKTSDQKLARLFSSANAFITMSEHEGFCVPLIEAMNYQIPIIAFKSGAIKNTLGNSGIQIPTKDPGLIAEAINSVINDPILRSKILSGQAQELKRFDYSKTQQDLLTIINAV